MTPDQNITAMYAAREVHDELLIAYHDRDERVKRVRLGNAERDFAKLAAALGYRVEKIQPEAGEAGAVKP